MANPTCPGNWKDPKGPRIATPWVPLSGPVEVGFRVVSVEWVTANKKCCWPLVWTGNLHKSCRKEMPHPKPGRLVPMVSMAINVSEGHPLPSRCGSGMKQVKGKPIRFQGSACLDPFAPKMSEGLFPRGLVNLAGCWAASELEDSNHQVAP